MNDETKKKNITRLPDGRYRLYTTRQGKPVRVIVTWTLLNELEVPVPEKTCAAFPGLELAKAALVKLKNKLIDEKRTGLIAASAKTRIGNLFQLMEQDYLRQGRKSWDDVLCRWNLHLKDHFANVFASELSSDDIARYIFARQREKASNASINRELSVIERMMHLGEQATPPLVRGVPYFGKLMEPPARTGFLEQYEYDKLRLHVHDLWLRALLATYYTHGFRKSELLTLRVRQVNLIDGTINLPAGATKNGKARTICMTSEVRTLVTALIQGKRPDDFVFTYDDGSPVKDFRGAWKKMFEDAGIEPRKLHDMRRSAIRNAIRRHVDRDTVKKMSGHLTDDVFSRYNIVAVDDMRDAAQKIEAGAQAQQTDIKTDISQKAPSESGQSVQ